MRALLPPLSCKPAIQLSRIIQAVPGSILVDGAPSETRRLTQRLEAASDWADVEAAERAKLRGRRSERNKACTFTLVRLNSSVPHGDLLHFDASAFTGRHRGDLNRVMTTMGGNPGGQLFACLHGAYDPSTDTFPLHFHGVATGGMIDVVDGLRTLGPYAPARPFDGRDAAITPVWMSDGPLTNMPDPLTYMMKRWWPYRETFLDTDGLRKRRFTKRQQIRGAPEAEYLMFLDRWRLEDITLIMGMHVTKAGLVVRSRD